MVTLTSVVLSLTLVAVQLDDAIDEQAAAVRTGAGVSAELHPGPPWDWWLGSSTLQGVRMKNVLRNYN